MHYVSCTTCFYTGWHKSLQIQYFKHYWLYFLRINIKKYSAMHLSKRVELFHLGHQLWKHLSWSAVCVLSFKIVLQQDYVAVLNVWYKFSHDNVWAIWREQNQNLNTINHQHFDIMMSCTRNQKMQHRLDLGPNHQFYAICIRRATSLKRYWRHLHYVWKVYSSNDLQLVDSMKASSQADLNSPSKFLISQQ